jgi:GTPase SAR1 family protein
MNKINRKPDRETENFRIWKEKNDCDIPKDTITIKLKNGMELSFVGFDIIKLREHKCAVKMKHDNQTGFSILYYFFDKKSKEVMEPGLINVSKMTGIGLNELNEEMINSIIYESNSMKKDEEENENGKKNIK